MAEPIGIQQLKDASLDVKSLEEVVNGDENVVVTTRLGETYPSLKGSIKTLFENGGLPATPFETKALMEASSLADNSYAFVTDDTDNSKNGFYQKNGSVWIKSKYSPNAFLDEINPSEGDAGYYIRSNGLVFESDSRDYLTASDYYEIDKSQDEIELTAYGREFIYAYAFYDENLKFLGGSAGDGFTIQTISISMSDIPENSKYIRYTGSINAPTGISKGVFNQSSLKKYIKINTVESDQELLSEINETLEPLDPFLQNEKSNNALTVAISKELQHKAEVEGYYLRDNGRVYISDSRPYLTVSDFYEIDRTQSEIILTAYGRGFIAAYLLCDENKLYMESTNGNGSGIQNITLSMSDIPSRAKYIRYTGSKQDPTGISKGVFGNHTLKSYVSNEISIPLNAQTIMLTGASFASEVNQWFLSANNKLGTTAINKARAGYGTPKNDAWDIWKGAFITDADFESIDIFCFQYANINDMHSIDGIKATSLEYTQDFDAAPTDNPFDQYTDAQAMDYILKFWHERCYEQRNKPNSKWYGSQHGKPFNVMLVTNWHDARQQNSASVRILAERWGFALCEFDKKIGFSMNTPTIDGKQVSLRYSMDEQKIDGVTYGWHPLRDNTASYIQGRLASIFTQSIIEWFGY